MKGGVVAAVLCLSALAACRPKTAPPPPSEPVPVASSGVDAGRAKPEPPPPLALDVDQVLFSAHGRLAFLGAERGAAFAVVDTASGRVQRYAGSMKETSALGWDSRCDASDRGYMPNVTVPFVETDPAETVFVRRLDKRQYREDVGRGTSLALPAQAAEDATAYASVVRVGKNVVRHGTDAIAPLPFDGEVFDSDDGTRRSALLGLDERGEGLVLDDLAGKRWRFHVGPDTSPPSSLWVSFDRGLLLTVRNLEAGKQALCAHELDGSGKSTCVTFVEPSPFFHWLVSDDGKQIAFGERIMGKLTPSPRDEYARDTSSDRCLLHVLDRASGKDTKWKSTCGITGELPLRFEGHVLVTDAARIHDCYEARITRYDVPTGAVLGNERRRVDDDVDATVSAAMKKAPEGLIDHAKKLAAWPDVYKLELVTWSEGDSVLARRGTDLLLCKKRGGSCSAPITTLPADATFSGGASKDGAFLGAVVGARFVAVDARTGAKKVDVAW